MTFYEMEQAVNQAKEVTRHTDRMTATMVDMVRGRLRTIDLTYSNADMLRKLKRELQQFNAVTGQWKD